MNLNNGEEKEVDLFFTQRCLELAKLLRTDQTEAFLQLYDSLPSEWNGSRLETAKETIREYQELDENDFQSLYQRVFFNEMSKQTLNNDPKIQSLSLKKPNDDISRRLQSVANHRTCTPVDSFVQLNLKPDINIRLEDYKKAIDTMPLTKSSSTNNRSVNLNKKHNRSHRDATFGYFSPHEQHSRSSSLSSSSSSSTTATTTTTTTTNSQKDLHKHENSESIRTASGSDSDEGEKKPLLANTTKSKLYSNERTRTYDDTLTLVLNQPNDHQISQHDLKLTLPEQNSYELVKSPTANDSPSCLPQMPRFKQPANDDPNGLNHSNNDLLSYTTQRSQLNNNPPISSSSHQTRNSERHEQQYNANNHSNSSRKSATRAAKKRKQLQQQEVIRTELIPGHRGDRDVDELVMFIDGDGGHSSTKQRQNSSTQRTIETNSNQTNSSTSKRKSRKSSKILQDNETKISNHDDDDDDNNIHFLDEHNPIHTTETHSFDEQINPDDDDESHSNTTNGEISLPEWHNTSSNNDEFDSLSLSSLTLNNSNSEIVSEPFVTVTHRRRSIKERRQETNHTNTNNRTARFSDKRRFQSTQNGLNRSTTSNSKSSIPIAKEEDQITSISLPPPPPPSSVVSTEIPAAIPPIPLPPPSSSSISEQTSPRLSSHSSSSSLSSLLKRQSKVAPPVVFLNKSIDVELNDVSFGFDMETTTTTTTDKPSTPTPTSPPSPVQPSLTSEPSVDKDNFHSSPTKRSYPQRNIRSQPFHSANTDIRSHQQRNYSSQPSSSYTDPYLLLQYQQQLAYMNYFRPQYLPSQSSYVLIPTVPPSSSGLEPNSNDKDSSNEQIHEPLFVYTTFPGQNQPIYYPQNKKSIYPSQYFYPATHPAYFQPISTSSVIDNKSQQDDTDHDDLLDDDELEHDYEKSSTRLFHRMQPSSSSSSSHIMSNALQLVYSQEKFNAQTDRFNLDQITAYLAMKWTETVDHYEQGDDEILLANE